MHASKRSNGTTASTATQRPHASGTRILILILAEHLLFFFLCVPRNTRMASANNLGMIRQIRPPTRRLRVTTPTPLAAESKLFVVPARTLTIWNVAMFVFHAAFCAVVLFLGKVDLTVPTYRTEITVVYTNESSSVESLSGNASRAWRLVPSYVEAGELAFTLATASFFALSALFHLLNGCVLRSFYLRQLAKCRTPTRYIEYTFSAAVMQLLIAYTLGVRERLLLLSSAVLVGITMPFGYWCELMAVPLDADTWCEPLRIRLLPWFVGNAPQVTAWLIVIVTFYDQTDNSAPAFVHAILWGELVLFFSFGFVALWQQLSTPSQFYQGEIMFQVLSLVAKGALGTILLANVLMLSDFAEIYDA